MQTHTAANPAATIIVVVVVPICLLAFGSAISFLIGKMSGWAAMARRFRSTFPFPSQTWHWKSARMRWGANYNNCLTIGADPTGLYLSTLFVLRIGHPALFVPWPEISIRGRRKIMFIECVECSLGREEQIPFLIRASLADQIRAAAGVNWPVEALS